MYIIGVGGGQVADKLRYSNILTTGEVRKVFATGGEFKCPYIPCIKSQRVGGGECGNSDIHRIGCSLYILEVKKVDFGSCQRVQPHRGGAFAVPFRVLDKKNDRR